MTRSNDRPANAPAEDRESWGGWADADRLRREAFLVRTPAQRLTWLQEALEIAYSAGALEPPPGTGRPLGAPFAE